MGLLGDEVVKFFLRDHTISISISTLDHLLEDGIISKLSKVLGNLSEVLQGNETSIRKEIPVFWIS
jgi:hypothetical protein